MKKAIISLDIKRIAEDLITMRIEDKDSMEILKKKFYSIMRKYGIKRGTRVRKGVIQNNTYEWTICWKLFLDRIISKFETDDIFNGVPKDLES